MKNYDFVEAEFGVACQFLQTEIAHSGSNEDDMDPTWYPATILWAPLHYANCAYCTGNMDWLLGVPHRNRYVVVNGTVHIGNVFVVGWHCLVD